MTIAATGDPRRCRRYIRTTSFTSPSIPLSHSTSHSLDQREVSEDSYEPPPAVPRLFLFYCSLRITDRLGEDQHLDRRYTAPILLVGYDLRGALGFEIFAYRSKAINNADDSLNLPFYPDGIGLANSIGADHLPRHSNS
jgi:hypothetical protein